MALPTTKDILVANLLAQRILKRKIFMELKEQTRYFHNVEITDIPWHEGLFDTSKNVPNNISPEFLAKYPFDFKVTFNTLGCNMLKCYKHNYREACKGKNPTVINNEFFKCQSGCYEVFEEFNDFLIQRFNLTNVMKGRRPQANMMELPFETTSIKDRHNNCFCGIQLTELKRFALLPSSRWLDWTTAEKEVKMALDPEKAPAYLTAKYANQPIHRRRLAGLVDSPPLGWNVANQNIKFNYSYCDRFVKEYDADIDACYTRKDRKAVGFLLGESFVQQFPDPEKLSLENYPLEYVYETVAGLNGIKEINKGYVERRVTHDMVSERTFTTHPDKKTSKDIQVINFHKFKTSTAKLFNDDDNDQGLGTALLEMVQAMAIEMSAETATVNLPRIMAKLIAKKVTPNLIESVILKNATIPFVTRAASVLIRTQLVNFSLKLSLRLIATFTATASIVFGIGILTVIPDILLSVFNVGGFQNEITREMVDEKKRQIIDKTINTALTDWGQTPIFRDLADNYVSPLITPEMIYNICIVNFVQMYPDLRMDIGNTGISETELQNVAFEYLSTLTVNSAGQTIPAYKQEDKQEKEIVTISLLNNKSHQPFDKKNNTTTIFNNDNDLYLLQAGIFCWVLSLLLFVFLAIKSKTLIVCGIICFTIWFTFIKTSIQKMKRGTKIK